VSSSACDDSVIAVELKFDPLLEFPCIPRPFGRDNATLPIARGSGVKLNLASCAAPKMSATMSFSQLIRNGVHRSLDWLGCMSSQSRAVAVYQNRGLINCLIFHFAYIYICSFVSLSYFTVLPNGSWLC